MINLTSKTRISLLEEIQLTGFYNQQEALYLNLIGNRRKGTFADNINYHDLCEFLNSGQNVFIPVTISDNLSVVSSSILDIAGGTASRSVVITYLDSNGDIAQSSPIPLNGITPVATGMTATAIWFMEVHESGGGNNGTSVGNIDLINTTTPTIIYERITANGNRSKSARLKVPTNYTAYLVGWYAASRTQAMDVKLRSNIDVITREVKPNGSFMFQDELYLPAGEAESKKYFGIIKEGGTVKISALADATNANAFCAATLEVILIKNQ